MRAVLVSFAIAACGSPRPATTPAAPPPAPVETAAPASTPTPIPEPAPTPAAAPDPALVDQGKQLVDKFGCIACHTSDGTARIGPTLKGYFGMKLVEQGGAAVVGSEERFRKSLEHAKALEGFPASMPAYKGMISDAEAATLIAYVKSL